MRELNGETGNNFEWKNGEVVPFEVSAPDAEQEGEELSDWLTRIGFEEEDETGHSDVMQLEIWRRSSGHGHAFVAVWGNRGAIRVVFIPTFDALLRFQALTAPILSAALQETYFGMFEQVAAKAFRAWHGHDDTAVCRRCDS